MPLNLVIPKITDWVENHSHCVDYRIFEHVFDTHYKIDTRHEFVVNPCANANKPTNNCVFDATER